MSRTSWIPLGVLFSSSILFTTVLHATTTTPPTITLEKAVHFLTPGGDDVVIPPGSYAVEQAELWLRLLPEARQEAVLVQAQATQHEEPLADSLVLSVPEEGADEHHVLLLLPDGKGLEAIGSYSGLRTRVAFPTLLSQAQRKEALGKSSAPTQFNTTSYVEKLRIRERNAQVALKAVSLEGKNFYACLAFATKMRPPICVTIRELSLTFPDRALAIADIVRTEALKGAGVLDKAVTVDFFLNIFPGRSWAIGCGGRGPHRGQGYLNSNNPTTGGPGMQPPAPGSLQPSFPGMDSFPQLGDFMTLANQGFQTSCASQTTLPGTTPSSSNTLTQLLGEAASSDSDLADFLGTYTSSRFQCQNDIPFPRGGTSASTGPGALPFGGIMSRGGDQEEKPKTPEPPPDPPKEPKPPKERPESLKTTVGKAWDKVVNLLGGDKTQDPPGSGFGGVRGDCFDWMSCANSCEVNAMAKSLTGLMKKYDFKGCNANIRENPDSPRTCSNVETGKIKVTGEVIRQLQIEWCRQTSGVMHPGQEGGSLCETVQGSKSPPALTRSICQNPKAMCANDPTGTTLPSPRTGFRGGGIGPVPITGPIPAPNLPFPGNVPFP